MAPHGRIVALPDVLYEARYSIGAISASKRSEQVALATISIAIRDGGNASELLARAQNIGAGSRPMSKRDTARALYFIASCLRRNGDMRYKKYDRAAIRHDPFHLRARLLLMR